MNKIERFIKIFHKLTLKLDDLYIKEYYYSERLRKFLILSDLLKKLKMSFKIEYVKDKELRDEYDKYMKENQDFVLFANALVATPDERKFTKQKEYIPFIAYVYQVLIWEFSQHFGITLPKSRDIGASYTLNIGAAMAMCTGGEITALYVSKTENDVDRVGDRLDTNMGRVRQVIESTTIYDLNKFVVSEYLGFKLCPIFKFSKLLFSLLLSKCSTLEDKSPFKNVIAFSYKR